MMVSAKGSIWLRLGIPTHEEVIGVRHIPAHPKQLHKVVELAVDVTTYLEKPSLVTEHCCDRNNLWSLYRNGGIDCDDIAFFNQQLACFVTYFADLNLWNRTACAQLRNSSKPSMSIMSV